MFAPVSPSSHYISWQWFLPFFWAHLEERTKFIKLVHVGSRSTSGKVSSHLRETARTDFCQTASWIKTEKIGLDPSNLSAIGNEFMAVIQYQNLCCSGKKLHLTPRLILGLTLFYSLRMVQTAMIVMRHIKGFAVHCYSYPVTRQSVCRNIHKFHQIPASNQNGKLRIGNFNACISESNTPTRI